MSGATTLLSMDLASRAGYGFSRFRFFGARVLMVAVLVAQMFPGLVLLIPVFTLASRAHLLNTYPILILAYTSFSLPFCVWSTRGTGAVDGGTAAGVTWAGGNRTGGEGASAESRGTRP